MERYKGKYLLTGFKGEEKEFYRYVYKRKSTAYKRGLTMMFQGYDKILIHDGDGIEPDELYDNIDVIAKALIDSN